jgi:hypothetical protein
MVRRRGDGSSSYIFLGVILVIVEIHCKILDHGSMDTVTNKQCSICLSTNWVGSCMCPPLSRA